MAALAFISFAEGAISPGRLVATLLVGVAIAAMFALLYALSRPRRTALNQE